MIFRDLEGGGGSVNSSLGRAGLCCEVEYLRLLVAGDRGDPGWYEESEPWAEGGEDVVRSLVFSPTAAGPRNKSGAIVDD